MTPFSQSSGRQPPCHRGAAAYDGLKSAQCRSPKRTHLKAALCMLKAESQQYWLSLIQSMITSTTLWLLETFSTTESESYARFFLVALNLSDFPCRSLSCKRLANHFLFWHRNALLAVQPCYQQCEHKEETIPHKKFQLHNVL